ncbi:DNA translocase FtsK [Psychrobacter frigidicola]|uniref:DNA translocase FtsK n=1 Tax=Psychrobacter frigidicola TaxID=45611 RepID=A0A5C7AA74_9GAMM|nr:DNA translocase FtsK 4TM domain-containing protein [Psychrobacter frigidicola]TXD98556.1 DNA translocase FtsK [Psychrobacter frigidicola]
MISAPLIEYLKKGIFTILGLMLSVYLFVILLTYTGNDPSWSHISSDMTTVHNTGGAMGAWLSDLLYSFFGLGAWWLLVFLIYESILIWWDNKPTFGLLRLVAYVFVILSASALIAQLVALIQPMTAPVITGVKGLAGGIIGTELQIRLAQLLTPWGSFIFLSLFVIITATFAFNIHWLVLYHKLTNLAWLGSGVKAEDNTATAFSNEQQNMNKRSRVQEGKDLIISKFTQKKVDYGQLPLDLQPAHQTNDDIENQAPDHSGRFSGVLSDFLAKSGLGASVKATMVAEAAMANSANARLQSPTGIPSNKTAAINSVNNNHTFVPTSHSNAAPNATTVRKVEPSFAWNDADTVHDLLANATIIEQNNPTHSPAPAEHAYIEPTQAAAPVAINTPTTETNSACKVDTSLSASNVDELADAWLAEHSSVEDVAVVSTSEAASTPEDSSALVDDVTHHSTVQFAPETLAEPIKELSEKVEEPLDVFEQMVSETSVFETRRPSKAPVSVPVIAKTPVSATVEEVASAVEPVVDMTPTNTPPANPKAAPAAVVNTKNATTSESVEPIPSPKPTISFAVPEGDSSNHITDMMPEDDSYDDADSNENYHAPVMPEIHNDAAFSQRSRAMQTAAYRAHLSPIPEMSILDKPDPNHQPSYTVAELEQLSELLEIKLQEFNVKAQVVNAIPGPVVTRFEVELAAGVKASKVTGISRDLARSLSMASLRVVEVIPGKPYIGIEVPNKQREMVRLIELLDTEKFRDSKSQISMAMGKDIGGKPIITDLARAPHMLVAGTTGSGKSVLVNAMLLSMLLKYTPNELRLILIDPKQLELANYNDIPHLLTPVVTDMTEAASSLSWCVAEMERRYQLMSLLKVRKLSDFNKKVIAAERAGTPMLDPLWRPNDNVSISQAPKMKTLPMIVIVADEFADMIMQVGKQAEELITRLAQKSRAAGIHLILATQRPSVDVITGLIKANIPVRAALRVNSKVDSRTILDSGGAEDMLGNGDMLFLGPGQIEPDRVHGAYVSDEEVNSVCDAWRERGAPDYIDNMAGNFELSSPGGSTGSPSGEDDDLYNDAVGFIMETRKVSASSIQRKFSIGYNRAARIVDSMEDAGLVSPMGKSGKRELLM